MKFIKNDNGNIAVSFVLSSVMFIALAGGLVDFSRAGLVKADLQEAADAAALLAAGSTGTEAERSFLAHELLYKNINTKNIKGDTEAIFMEFKDDVEGASRAAEVSVTFNMKTGLLGVIGLDVLPISVFSQAKINATAVEIVMLLDISGSMQPSGLQALKDATEGLIDAIDFDNNDIVMTVIPWSYSFNAGSYFRKYVRASERHKFTGCFNLDSSHMNDDALDISTLTAVDDRLCRSSMNDSIFISDDPQEIKQVANNMSISYGLIDSVSVPQRVFVNTEMDIAIGMGLKALSPSMRSKLRAETSDFPQDYNSDVKKYMVLMTDGIATDRWRYDDTSPSSWPEIRVLNSSETRNNVLEACRVARGLGIEVYTVSFNTNSDPFVAQDLKQCSTTDEHYMEATTSNIDDIFKEIASQIGQLRISQ